MRPIAGGGRVRPIAGGGRVRPIAGGGRVRQIAGGGRVRPIAGGGLDFAHNKVYRAFYNSGDVELRANLDLRRGNLRDAVAAAVDFAAELHLVVHRFVRLIVSEAVERILASVEARLAELGLVGFVLAAFLVLKSSAGHVLVEALVCFHVLSFRFCQSCIRHCRPPSFVSQRTRSTSRYRRL